MIVEETHTRMCTLTFLYLQYPSLQHQHLLQVVILQCQFDHLGQPREGESNYSDELQ